MDDLFPELPSTAEVKVPASEKTFGNTLMRDTTSPFAGGMFSAHRNDENIVTTVGFIAAEGDGEMMLAISQLHNDGEGTMQSVVLDGEMLAGVAAMLKQKGLIGLLAVAEKLAATE